MSVERFVNGITDSGC